MPRGYRCIVFAAVGWLALCGAKPPAEQPNRPNSTQEGAPAAHPTPTPTPDLATNPSTNFTAYPGYDPDPCYHAKDHAAADLCAQWRASIAAEKAAHEARRATNLAWASTILSALAILGLILTILQGRKGLDFARRGNLLAMRENARSTRRAVAGADETKTALEIAERNAEATAALVEVYRTTGTKQIRCYLSCTGARIGFITNGSALVCCTIKNNGQSPALNTSCTANIHLFSDGFVNKQIHQSKAYNTVLDIPAGGESEMTIGDYQLIFRDDELAPFKAKKPMLISMDVSITATDVFGEVVETEDRLVKVVMAAPDGMQWIDLERASKPVIDGIVY